MAISSTATLPPFPYTGTFSANFDFQVPPQQYIYKLDLPPGSYDISVLPDLIVLTTAVDAPSEDDLNVYSGEALIGNAYVLRTINYYDDRGLYSSSGTWVATLQSKTDTLATEAMESAGYLNHEGTAFYYYSATVPIEGEKIVKSETGTTHTTYTSDYFLYVEGWRLNYSYWLEAFDSEIQLNGRFLITLGNPTGQRTQTWGDEWLNVQTSGEYYAPPVTPPSDDNSGDSNTALTVMQQVVGQIPTSSAWNIPDNNGQTFSPAYVVETDGAWYQVQSADETTLTASWSGGSIATQLYDNLSESVYKYGIDKVADYCDTFGLPASQFVTTYESAQEFKGIYKEFSTRLLEIAQEGMQGVIRQSQGGTFDVEIYWNSLQFAVRDFLKDSGKYVFDRVFSGYPAVGTLVSTLHNTSLDIAYSNDDSASIKNSIDTALKVFAASVAAQAADKYEIIQKTIDTVGAQLKIDVEALDTAKILADATELGDVVINNAVPYTIDAIKNEARWLGLYKDVPLQVQTVNSIVFGVGRIGGMLTGAAMSDVFFAGDCGSTLIGEGGNDLLIGGNGMDTAVFSRNRTDYTFTKATTHSLQVNGTDGNDTLLQVERCQFADGFLAFDIDGNAGEVYRLYKAAFDRTPDTPGLGYWIKEFDAQANSLLGIANGFIISAEFQTLYGSTNTVTDRDFITLLYNNVLDRDPDQSGFEYWEAEITRGFSREALLTSFSESAENKANVLGAIESGIWYV